MTDLDPRYALEPYLERLSARGEDGLGRPIDPEELLVRSHRDLHPANVHAGYMLSRTVKSTGSEAEALRRFRQVRTVAWRLSALLARVLGQRDPSTIGRTLFGLETPNLFRYRHPSLDAPEIEQQTVAVRENARSRLNEARSKAGLRVLLTGGTGFLGQELIHQALEDPGIEALYVLIRPQRVPDSTAPEGSRILEAAERGRLLLGRLGVADSIEDGRIHFLTGDIEEEHLGLEPAIRSDLAQRLTHVIHCAASVAFDAPYEESFRANVEGSRRVLRFSEDLHRTPGSPFVAHLSVETSYVHGRQSLARAQENAVVFPRNYYNNFYELTKAMASLEAEIAFLERGLPIVHLCPSIVIGHHRTGNNRGDTKVVNAPVNLFGRAHRALERQTAEGWLPRSKAALLARLACVFPGDPSAEINLIPVDWVARGILAALHRPDAIGERIHLANDRRLTAERLTGLLHQELGVRIRLTDPTLHRNLGLPVVHRILRGLRLESLAQAMNRTNTVFGGYSEWGQPVHEVGNDVHLLGLPASRPDPEACFRLLCRHNRWVQEFGRMRDPDEITRREFRWASFLDELERRTGQSVGTLEPETFHAEVEKARPFDP